MSGIRVTSYVRGHGVFSSTLTAVLRTAQRVEEAFRPEDGGQPYPLPFRAVLEAWAVTCGFAERSTSHGPAYLMDHEDEEECLVMLSSFHPLNGDDQSVSAIESWERSLEALALECLEDDEFLDRQFHLSSH